MAASSGHFIVGNLIGWSANALPAIDDDPDIELTVIASSFIGPEVD